MPELSTIPTPFYLCVFYGTRPGTQDGVGLVGESFWRAGAGPALGARLAATPSGRLSALGGVRVAFFGSRQVGVGW